MEDKNIVMWVMLLVLLALCSYWHVRENKQIIRESRNNPEAFSGDWLTRFAWSRTVQFLLALGGCVLVIILYDWQLRETRVVINDLKKIQQTTAAPVAQPLPIKPEATEPPPLTVAPETPVQTPPAPELAINPLSDVYNPEGTEKNQAVLDSLKKRYEDILVTYLFLKKCGKANLTDYHVIMSALSQEMASVNAPGRLQNDIQTAAQGSFREIYAQSSCENIDALSTQYNSYIGTLSQQSLAP